MGWRNGVVVVQLKWWNLDGGHANQLLLVLGEGAGVYYPQLHGTARRTDDKLSVMKCIFSMSQLIHFTPILPMFCDAMTHGEIVVVFMVRRQLL